MKNQQSEILIRGFKLALQKIPKNFEELKMLLAYQATNLLITLINISMVNIKIVDFQRFINVLFWYENQNLLLKWSAFKFNLLFVFPIHIVYTLIKLILFYFD